MSYREWYVETYKEEWKEEYATFDVWKYTTEYEKYCEANVIKPVWDIISN